LRLEVENALNARDGMTAYLYVIRMNSNRDPAIAAELHALASDVGLSKSLQEFILSKKHPDAEIAAAAHRIFRDPMRRSEGADVDPR
jgi:hypothetical protein